MPVDDLFGDGQTQAGAAGLGCLGPMERDKDPGKLFFGYFLEGVGDTDL